MELRVENNNNKNNNDNTISLRNRNHTKWEVLLKTINVGVTNYNEYYIVLPFDQITNSMRQTCSCEAKSPSDTQAVPHIYGTQCFITALTKARHPVLSLAWSLEFIPLQNNP